MIATFVFTSWKSSRLSLDRHTLLKWLCFLQKLYVLPLAGHYVKW
jgi:hypothetical protein